MDILTKFYLKFNALYGGDIIGSPKRIDSNPFSFIVIPIFTSYEPWGKFIINCQRIKIVIDNLPDQFIGNVIWSI